MPTAPPWDLSSGGLPGRYCALPGVGGKLPATIDYDEVGRGLERGAAGGGNRGVILLGIGQSVKWPYSGE